VELEEIIGIALEKDRPLALATPRDVQYGITLALALTDADKNSQGQITKLMNELANRFPEDTVVQFNYLPTIKALVEINQANPAKSIEILEAAQPYELGSPSNISMSLNLYPVYVRGLAYVAAKQGPEAAAEFQKIPRKGRAIFSFSHGRCD